MTKNEMIDLLIMDRICDWIFARNYDPLKDILLEGFKGYEEYTNEELKDAVENFDDEELEDLKGMLKLEENRSNEVLSKLQDPFFLIYDFRGEVK